MHGLPQLCLHIHRSFYTKHSTGQLLNNHVAVETDRNVRRFDREGLRQLQFLVTDEDLSGRNVLHFYLFLLLCDCSEIAQSYLCRSNEPLKVYKASEEMATLTCMIDA